MKNNNFNIGQIAYLLLTISAIGHIGHNKNVSPILYYLYIFGYGLITAEKFNLHLKPYLNGDLLLVALYLINLKFNYLSTNNILTIFIILNYLCLAMIKSFGKYKKFIYLFSSIIYGFIFLSIYFEENKNTFKIIKLCACLLLAIYYFSYFIKKNPEHLEGYIYQDLKKK